MSLDTDHDLTDRLHALAHERIEAPYDWAEFQRRCAGRSRGPGEHRRRRLASAAVVLIAACAVTALGYHLRAGAPPHAAAQPANHLALSRRAPCARSAAPQATGAPACTDNDSPGAHAAVQPMLASTAATYWLAHLPHEPVVHRVGTQAAETGLVEQIATLDELLSAARVSGAPPERLAPLERQRAQLVGSLAQFRYAELLASATR